MKINLISAGAGSGKTYTLTQKMTALLRPNEQGSSAVRASGIMATTFTKEAAAELQERVRVKLLSEGLKAQADALGTALIGTVHSLGSQLLKRFAFEAGISPNVNIIEEQSAQIIFNQSLSTILQGPLVEEMDRLSLRLSMEQKSNATNETKDWRNDLRDMLNKARENNLDVAALEQSKNYSIEQLLKLLPQKSPSSAENWNRQILSLLDQTATALRLNELDQTKATQDNLHQLDLMRQDWEIHRYWSWGTLVKTSKSLDKIGAKSRDLVQDFKNLLLKHEEHPEFQEDLKTYISNLFDICIEAHREFESYKKKRGLIDYFDMEALVLKLLEQAKVQEVLSQELDLLLVDEFQDTSPMQLQIFLQLSRLAKQSIWVGDPKQSIYGFRGADPQLMEAVVEACADSLEVLPYSWRSRPDLIRGVNGLFLRAFSNKMPQERIILQTPPHSKPETKLQTAHKLWYFRLEGKKKVNAAYQRQGLSQALQKLLQNPQSCLIRDRKTQEIRPIKPGDIAILCRSNKECADLAQNLATMGLPVSLGREGLLQTAEACLVLACLRFALNPYDSLSIAELLLLGQGQELQTIINLRISFLEQQQNTGWRRDDAPIWAEDKPFIQTLKNLRRQVSELSATEILDLILTRLEIPQLLATWPDASQRMDNIEALRALALDYEDRCNNLQVAASLSGFLLWLEDLNRANIDKQGLDLSKDAIRLLTYHASKGLEWPLIITESLGKEAQNKVFGLRVISPKELNLQQPLKGRILRYWPNPYGSQEQNTQLVERINNTPEELQFKQEMYAEEARLLYVGLTRARDYLVFPQYQGQEQKWLNRVFHQSKDLEKQDCLRFSEHQLPWSWPENESLALQLEEYLIPALDAEQPQITEVENHKKEQKYYTFFAPSIGPQTHSLAMFDQAQDLYKTDTLSLENENPDLFSTWVDTLELENWKRDAAELLPEILGNFVRYDQPNQSYTQRLNASERYLKHWNLEPYLQANDFIRYAQELAQIWGGENLIEQLNDNLDFMLKRGGRYYRGLIHRVYQLKNKQNILIHFSSMGNLDKTKAKARALEEAYALLAGSEALRLKGNLAFWVCEPSSARIFRFKRKD